MLVFVSIKIGFGVPCHFCLFALPERLDSALNRTDAPNRHWGRLAGGPDKWRRWQDVIRTRDPQVLNCLTPSRGLLPGWQQRCFA